MARQPPSGKAITNEREHPYVAQLSVPNDELNVETSRRIINFHSSIKIQARHGRRIVIEGKIYFRWCFSDLVTAHAFMEQFGGKLTKSGQPERPRR